LCPLQMQLACLYAVRMPLSRSAAAGWPALVRFADRKKPPVSADRISHRRLAAAFPTWAALSASAVPGCWREEAVGGPHGTTRGTPEPLMTPSEPYFRYRQTHAIRVLERSCNRFHYGHGHGREWRQGSSGPLPPRAVLSFRAPVMKAGCHRHAVWNFRDS